MEDSGFLPHPTFGALSSNAMDMDFMDELLFDGCWLETTGAAGFNFQQSVPPASYPPINPSQAFFSDSGISQLSIDLPQHVFREGTPKCFLQNASLVSPKIEEAGKTSQESEAVQNSGSLGKSGSFRLEGSKAGKRLWVGPRAYPGPSSSVKERLMLAISHLKDFMKARNALIQIWVPIKRDGRQVLTTKDQPFSLDPDCRSLAYYRDVSSIYQFLADEKSKISVGLPGRVFSDKLPEWTPDVRFFRREEYPRIPYAQQYNVQGSIALPVFERGSRACLGVVEFVTTTQKTNYRSELETVCKALQAVDLRSSDNSSTPGVKAPNESYQAALPEIVEVLTLVCKTHKLPLAQTWASCIQQCKDGCRHSNENYKLCVSTVDSACFVADIEMFEFHEACSEYHLFQGQGLVGNAFLTKKPIFASDITAFTKTAYPLSHHARIFGLRAAAAIPLRSIHAGAAVFVLEFFLPKECQNIEEQKVMLNSVFTVIQQSCQALHVVMGDEFQREVTPPAWDVVVPFDDTFSENKNQSLVTSSKEISSDEPSWIAHMIQAQQKGHGVSILMESRKEPKQEFSLTASWDDDQVQLQNGQVLSEFGQLQKSSGGKTIAEGNHGSSSVNRQYSFGTRKLGEKRRTKMEKSVSVQVLRQYFAGSLKDAAKSIGVCPTTLKRICRQHGISRWPSRKIKKVGHSLNKLQRVIDSVQGAEGAIQIGNFYKNFPELSSPNFSGSGPILSSKTSDHSQQTKPQPENGIGSLEADAVKRPSSSGSHSSGSTTCSTGAKQQTATINASSNASSDHCGLLKRSLSEAELHFSNQEEPKFLSRSQSHKLISDPPRLENLATLPQLCGHDLRDASGFKIKAAFGDEKVRFSLRPNWGITDLREEIASRFNIDDVEGINIKYMDDEHEWVLLTCDADLDECVDIHRSYQSRQIKLSIYRASSPLIKGSIGNTGQS